MSVVEWILNPKNGWKVLSIVVFLSLPFITLTFLGGFEAKKESNQQADNPLTVSKQTPSSNAGRLSIASQIINKPESTTDEIEEAVQYLKSIPADADEYQAAQILLRRAAGKQENTKFKGRVTKEIATAKRRKAIRRMQEEVDKNNGAVAFSLEGIDEDILRISGPLMSQEVANGLVNQNQLLTGMKAIGIKTIVFTNGKTFTSEKSL